MRFKQVGNKADIIAVVIHNAEASAVIPKGAPVILALNGTNDGLDVVLPATTAQDANGALYGVCLSQGASLANGAYGEAQVFGVCNNLLLTSNTRAATTDSWSTKSADTGVALVVDTVNNAFSTSGGTQAKSSFLPFAILAQSFTVSGSASATSDTRTAITQLVKSFLRMM